MPRKPKCDCGTCGSCRSRKSMQKTRALASQLDHMVWPSEEPWASQARRHAEQLTVYVSPLSLLASKSYFPSVSSMAAGAGSGEDE